MPGKRRNSLENRIQERIQRSPDSVFVRTDFADLEKETGYDQVGRALRCLLRKGVLLKAGYGVYVQAQQSRFSGKLVPMVDIEEMTRQAMRKLGVQTEPTLMEQRYNTNTSTQLPTGRVIRVKGRVSRQLEYNGVPIRYEYA
jgi:hypothetical protein